MTNVANCDMYCDLQNSWIIEFPARTSVRVSVQKLKSVLYNSFGEDFVLCQCWVFNSVACSGVCRCAWKVVTLNSEVLCGCLSVCVLDEGCLGVLVESSALWIWFGFEPKAAARATMSATTISNGGSGASGGVWCCWKFECLGALTRSYLVFFFESSALDLGHLLVPFGLESLMCMYTWVSVFIVSPVVLFCSLSVHRLELCECSLSGEWKWSGCIHGGKVVHFLRGVNWVKWRRESPRQCAGRRKSNCARGWICWFWLTITGCEVMRAIFLSSSWGEWLGLASAVVYVGVQCVSALRVCADMDVIHGCVLVSEWCVCVCWSRVLYWCAQICWSLALAFKFELEWVEEFGVTHYGRILFLDLESGGNTRWI